MIMATISLSLDDQLTAALESISSSQGCDKETLVAKVIRKYIEAEQLRKALEDPELIKLYQELADEDVALAEAGMDDYQKMLLEAENQ